MQYEHDLKELQKNIDYTFSNINILKRSLIHSSYAHECHLNEDNERQEFLGDAILELCISDEIYKRFPDAREGEMTQTRSKLVNTKSLAERARDIGLDKVLCLGKGEEKQGGRNRDSLLADAFEAFIAAIYEDSDFENTKAIILKIFSDIWPNTISVNSNLDNKTLLQTLVQQHFKQLPTYQIIRQFGPEHDKWFEVCLMLPNGQCFYATSNNSRKAEQLAAKAALDNIFYTY